jgi:hypothetical protein
MWLLLFQALGQLTTWSAGVVVPAAKHSLTVRAKTRDPPRSGVGRRLRRFVTSPGGRVHFFQFASTIRPSAAIGMAKVKGPFSRIIEEWIYFQ